MGEKKAPRLTPEQNEARQEARRLKRQRSRDAQVIAVVSGLIEIERAIRKMEPLEDDGLLSLATLRVLRSKDAAKAD